MCLAVPMRIVELGEQNHAVAELDGVRQNVNLALLEGAALGDYVIIHAGFAIERLKEEEANQILEAFADVARVMGQEPAAT